MMSNSDCTGCCWFVESNGETCLGSVSRPRCLLPTDPYLLHPVAQPRSAPGLGAEPVVALGGISSSRGAKKGQNKLRNARRSVFAFSQADGDQGERRWAVTTMHRSSML